MNKNIHANRVIESTGIPKFALDELKRLEKKVSHEKSVLSVDNIDKIYDNGFQAIFGTSLNLQKGEFLALLGPSGCGKTTTLRMIAGLEEVTRGDIYIDGSIATNAEPSDRNITMVFQNYALFPHLSVKGNIAFGLKANKKKLGKGGDVYKKIRTLQNEIRTQKSLVKNIKNLDSLKRKVRSLTIKHEKINSKLDELQSQLNDKNSNTLTIKIDKLKINFHTIENLINKGKEDIKNYESKLHLIPELEKSIARKIKKYESVGNRVELEHYGKLLKSFQKKAKPLSEEINDLKTKEKKLESERALIAKNDNYAEIINQKIEEAGETLGLSYYLDRKPSALSGGQRQRVALGRSIVGNPTLFLMDEPLSNLDAKLRASMRRKIRELHDKINSATVYVTHDQVEAMTMADKIAVMSDGFVMQIGNPKDVYKNPSCKFVASFVGTPTMNMYDGIISKGYFVEKSGFKIKLPKDKLINTSEGQSVTLGIRPTDVSTDVDVKKTYNATLKVKVISRELLGNEIQYAGIIEGTKEELTFVTSAYDDLKLGEVTTVNILASRIHIFDNETSIALTSKFNFETLQSLKNWSEATEKIAVRRKIMEDSKKKSMKQGIIKRMIKKNN